MVLKISTFKGFPELEDGKIDTVRFIEASREVIGIIESFGTLFVIALTDIRKMSDNLMEHCREDETSRKYLEDMILADETTATHSWLLWLKRALEMMDRFFVFLISDEKFFEESFEDLEPSLSRAYEEVLKPFHVENTQGNFSLILPFLPKRSDLLGSGLEFQINVEHILEMQHPMKNCIDRINNLYRQNGLNDQEMG